MFFVKNLPEPAEIKCSCRTWLEHWEKAARRKATTCARCSRPGFLLKGCTVRGIIISTGQEFVVPLCKACSQDRRMYVGQGTLVPIEPSESCEIMHKENFEDAEV